MTDAPHLLGPGEGEDIGGRIRIKCVSEALVLTETAGAGSTEPHVHHHHADGVPGARGRLQRPDRRRGASACARRLRARSARRRPPLPRRGGALAQHPRSRLRLRGVAAQERPDLRPARPARGRRAAGKRRAVAAARRGRADRSGPRRRRPDPGRSGRRAGLGRRGRVRARRRETPGRRPTATSGSPTPSTCSRARSPCCSARRSTRRAPGSYAFVPPGNRHTVSNPGDEPVRFLNVTAPGGLERYLRELGRTDPADFAAMAARNDVLLA